MNVSPELRTALLAEIEKALPRLLKKALASLDAEPTPRRRPGTSTRMAKGIAKQAIIHAVFAYEDKGASRSDIRRVAASYLKQPLNENTLKRWLVVLRQEEKIETRNGRWFPLGARTAGIMRTPAQSFKQGFNHKEKQIETAAVGPPLQSDSPRCDSPGQQAPRGALTQGGGT